MVKIVLEMGGAQVGRRKRGRRSLLGVKHVVMGDENIQKVERPEQNRYVAKERREKVDRWPSCEGSDKESLGGEREKGGEH